MQLAILKSLEMSHPRMTAEEVVKNDVRFAVNDFSMAAFESALDVLERKGQVRIYKGEDVTRIALTDDGLNRLAQIR